MYAFNCEWPDKECVDFTDCQRCMEEVLSMYSSTLTESDIVGRHIEKRWRLNVLKIKDSKLKPQNRLYSYGEYYNLFTSQPLSDEEPINESHNLTSSSPEENSKESPMVNLSDLMNREILTPEKRLVCQIGTCNKSYSSIYGLKYHMKNGHRKDLDSSKKFVCTFPLCGRRYKNANGLKYHIKKVHLIGN